jgi:hypothetical protein
VTILCGSLLPSQLETLPARKLVGPIRFCTLAAWLRANIQPCYDTSQLTPAETAERIATWISRSITMPTRHHQRRAEPLPNRP